MEDEVRGHQQPFPIGSITVSTSEGANPGVSTEALREQETSVSVTHLLCCYPKPVLPLGEMQFGTPSLDSKPVEVLHFHNPSTSETQEGHKI